MNDVKFDKAKCQQRNRLAARRDGVEATPMRLLRQAVTVGQGATSALGSLPKDDAEALARINAGRAEGAEPLTADDVYIHYCEAANSNFIADRYAFLSTKTLKNIAKDAQAGFAFMNSHRTGGLSHPSELPFGRTFAGRYEKAEDGGERAIIGFYMLRGVAPNGGNGPTTDDLNRGIEAGTIFDVSVGLYGGAAICDVCGNDLNDYDECPHMPGTDYALTPEQQAAQKERGVSDGMASYTLDNARCGETSAVYDGAVPGAGFNKTLSFAKRGALSQQNAAQARHAYASLLSKGDLHMGEDIIQAIKDGFSSLGEQLGIGKKDKADKALAVAPPAPEQSGEPETPLAELRLKAAWGEKFVSDLREKAKAQAVVAFGVDSAEGRASVEAANTLIEVSGPEVLSAMTAQYATLAQAKGLQNADGSAKSRQSAAAPLPVAAEAKHAAAAGAGNGPADYYAKYGTAAAQRN